MLQSIEWAALEWLTPFAVWWHLQLGPVPHLVLALALFAIVCGIIAAIRAAGARVVCAAPATGIVSLRRLAQSRYAPKRRADDAPIGGAGPRAPASSHPESPAAV